MGKSVKTGIFSGTTSVIIGFCIGERITYAWSVFAVLGVGFIGMGLAYFSTFTHGDFSVLPELVPTMQLLPLSERRYHLQFLGSFRAITIL